MSASLDRFMNNVRMRLPGALDDAIKYEVFNTLDEFCKETNAWQEKITLSVTATDLEYEIEPEDNRATIVKLLYVTKDGQPSVAAALPNPELLAFQDLPSVTSEYIAVVALTVIDPVSVNDALPDRPDWFFTLYSQELLDGVLSKMMSQPAKPYSSPTSAVYHGRRFRNALSKVRVAVEHQHTQGTQRWRFPAFAR